jgi:flagellar biosynthesis/type III secretory pathway protein FliH
MSDARTAKPVVFPTANEPVPTKPAWLDDLRGGPLRKLFEPANEAVEQAPSLMPNERASLRPSEMPPGAAGPSQYPGAAPAGQSQAPQPSAAQAAQNSPAAQAAAAAQAAQAAANVAANAAQRAAEAAAAVRPDYDEHEQAGASERPPSKLPPPPKLGSLIPGARSAPPANDTGFELLQEQREAFTHAALELSIARAATMTELEGQLLDLSIEIASALIEREIEHDPTLHSTLARAALASLGDAERVTLSTSTNAYEAICQTLGGPEATISGVHVTVHADESIPGLGCVVDGQNVRIDATVAERLRAVRRAFEDERRKVAENTE